MARSGIASPVDYLLGRGELYFSDDLDADGRPKGFRTLGNTEAFTVTVEAELLEHFSSLAAAKVKDREVVLSQEMNFNFQMTEIDVENLAMFMSGTETVVAQTGAVVPGAAGDDNVQAVKQGEWFDLFQTDAPTEYPEIGGDRAYRITAGPVVKDTTATTTYDINDDYLVDLEMGRIFIVEGGAISDGDDLAVGFTYATLDAKTEVRALGVSKFEGVLKFVSRNANKSSESEWEYTFHQVTLTADGDFALISDEFSTLNVKGAAESNAIVSPNSPYCTVVELSATGA